ncbi:TRAP transporter substrate-binding protein [Marivivens aquimaris]|uniref:TRAP transporter substrate-binding protein n=1 Tax=Marivivens aquimaris TaxID=2774876 RepID=UPI001881D0BF|nr:TRAP transporter substrate-binding protein [Marivivens aquimaris]
MKLKALLGAATALTVIALPAVAQDYSLKLHHFLSERSPAHQQMLVPWAERVEELTEGRVDIEVYPSMTLGGRPPELVQQARDGVVDLIWTLNGYTPGLFPRTEVFELPTVFVNDPTAANLAMREMFDEYLAEEYKGLEVMFLQAHAGNALHMVDADVRSPADLEGLKLRTPSRTGAWVIEALGASPVAMPVPELPQALSKKVVEGALIPWEIIPALQLQEQTDYQIEGPDMTRFGTSIFQVSMNKDVWESLPADIQDAFRQASNEEWLTEVGGIWRGADDFGINMATEAGNTHVTLSAEEYAAFEEPMNGVVDRWIEEANGAGLDGNGLVEAARAAIASHAE